MGGFNSLDLDVKTSRLERYEKSKQEVKEWLFKTLGMSGEQKSQYESEDLVQMLKSGTVLCELGRLVDVPNNPCSKAKNSKMPFVQMENISFFLNLCDSIGLPHDEIFQTVDLFDNKDPYQVVITIISFSRHANQRDPGRFPDVIGPKVAKMRP